MSAPPRITLLRHFATDITTLMDCWTAPQHLARWWAAGSARVMFAEITPRPGGNFVIVTQDADHHEAEERGRFTEITSGDAILIEWAGDAPHSLVLQFWPENEGEGESKRTELTLNEGPFPDGATRDLRQARWIAALDRLAMIVEPGAE